MTNTTIELSADERTMVTTVITAESKVEKAQVSADEAWVALMTVVLADEAKGLALRDEYVSKRLAKARRVKGEALTDDETAEVTRSAKNVWKARKSNVKNGGRKNHDGNRMVTVKGKDERAADARSAIRLALAAGVTSDALRVIIAEEAAKLS